MDTELHAIALPDSDRTNLKRPETAARELGRRDAAGPNSDLRGICPV